MKKEPFLYLSAFAMDGCFGIVALCVPLLAMQLGAAYDDLGAITATGSLFYVFSCLVLGRLADRVGYRRSMTISALIIALILLSYLAVTRVGHLFLLAGINGLIMGGFWPAMQAWLGRGKDRRQLLRAVGGFNVSWSLGFMVGPLVGGTLYAMNPDYPFALTAGLVSLLFVALLLARVREAEPAGAEASETTSFPAAQRFLPVAWVANFATFFAAGTVRSLFPKLATDLGIPPGPLGHLLALIALAQLVAFVLISRTDRWQFRLAPLAAAQFLGAGGLLIIAFGTSSGVFALGLLIHGLQLGITFTASIFYSLHAQGSGGRRTGIHEAIVGSGFLLGPLIGGFTAEYLGPRFPYFLSSGVILGALALQVYLLRRGPGREEAIERDPGSSQ